MARLIDADALIDALMAYTWRDEDERLIDDADEKREFIKNWMPDLPTVGGWISVKDRLPKDDREVLVAYKMTGKDMKFWGVETASCIAGNGEVNWISLWDEYRIPNGSKRVITHWMPLPKPPKEESDGNCK